MATKNKYAQKKFEEFVTKEVRELIPQWKSEGRTDAYVSEQIGVGTTTLKKWKKENPNFAQLFAKGKHDALEKVKGTMLELATGKTLKKTTYFVDSITKEIKGDIKIVETEVVSTDMIKHLLATEEPEVYGKKALNGEQDGNQEDVPIFGGDDEL